MKECIARLRRLRMSQFALSTLLTFPILGISDCSTVDADGDGHVPTADCDDNDSAVYPGANEICDGLDQDCNGIADEVLDIGPWYLDFDGDGFGDENSAVRTCNPSPYLISAGGDCDDSNPTVYPAASDLIGDDLDSDCGGFDGSDPSVGLPGSQFQSIQEAVNAAQDDPAQTVWVGPGIHFGADISFGGKALRLKSTHGEHRTSIDAQWVSSVFVFDQGEGPESVLEGFTITGGFANESCFPYGCDHYGGGILVMNASPTLHALTLTENRAFQGGGLAAYGTDLSAQYLTLLNNIAEFYGGGLYLVCAESVLLSHSHFSGNLADNGAGIYGADIGGTLEGIELVENVADGTGGGMLLSHANPILFNAYFYSNRADSGNGGGAFLELSESRAPSLNRVRFTSNSAVYGGGALYVRGPGPTLVARHLSLESNSAGSFGGALALSNQDVSLTHARLTGNHAGEAGGAIQSVDGTVSFMQTVIAGNNAPECGGVFLHEAALNYENGILAYNEGGNLRRNEDERIPSRAILNGSALYNPSGFGANNVLSSGSYSTLEPEFLAYTDPYGNTCSPGNSTICLPSDLHLSPTSPLIDWGMGSGLDQDGTPPDPGLYGGSGGSEWDRDRDSRPDWFWPGYRTDAPDGFSSDVVDFDDGNAGE